MIRLVYLLLVSLLYLNKVSTLSLHYDKAQHSYDELLISISPDVPGLELNIEIFLYNYSFLETDRDITINNIKKWITEE